MNGVYLRQDNPLVALPFPLSYQVIYVAPMKALAAEMVRNFGSRLAPLGVSVRELTGDMQLTKSEIHNTQVKHIILASCCEEL